MSQVMARAADKDLLFVSKAPKERLDMLAAGISLAERTGYSVATLRQKAVTDRLALARSHLNAAELAAANRTPCYRSAVSRAYYSMYHAARAMTYFDYGGDDNESHSKLPGNLPSDFYTRLYWENELKQARLERNRADYDPYPRNDLKFGPSATNMIGKAKQFLPIVRQYLRTKGWKP